MPRRALSILIVEDDLAVAELLRSLLSGVSGWTTIVAHDAAGAREIFHKAHISALVLDINLPDATGTELLTQLKLDSHWHSPLVILTSANSNQPAIYDAIQHTPHSCFIPKPFDVDEIVAALEALTPASPTPLPVNPLPRRRPQPTKTRAA
jgi:DNA-binding response OmpR family regulator